jgi:hypothetical protein
MKFYIRLIIRSQKGSIPIAVLKADIKPFNITEIKMLAIDVPILKDGGKLYIMAVPKRVFL